MRSVRRPGAGPRRLLFVTVLGVGVGRHRWSTCSPWACAGRRWPACRCWPSTRCRSPCTWRASRCCRSSSAPIGFLWLLVADNVDRVRRFGRRFTGDGRDVDVWEPSPLAAAGRRLAVGRRGRRGAAAAGRARHDHRPADPLTQVGTGNGTGRRRHRRQRPGQPVRRRCSGSAATRPTTTTSLKVDDQRPGPVLPAVRRRRRDHRAGLRATAPRAAGRSPAACPTRGRPARRGRASRYQQYRATVEITDDFDMELAPTYTAPIGTDGPRTAWSYDPTSRSSSPTAATAKDKKYTFDYVRGGVHAGRAARRPAAGPGQRARRAVHHGAGGPAGAATLVEELIGGKRTTYDKVRGDLRLLLRGQRLQVQPADRAGGTAGADIVELPAATRSGFCQQYAAAMAWMVRAAGIPARVAFGFTRGTDRDGDTYT